MAVSSHKRKQLMRSLLSFVDPSLFTFDDFIRDKEGLQVFPGKQYRYAELFMNLFMSSLVSFACLLFGCSQRGPDSETKIGFEIKNHLNGHSKEFHFTQFSPRENGGGRKLPMIVFLNGLGQNGNDGLALRNNFGPQVWENARSFPFIVIAPQCSTGGTWSAESDDTKRAFEVINDTINKCNVDPDRIYLTGVSSGGFGVWKIGSFGPDKFAALVPLCGGGGSSHQLAVRKLPSWSFCNEDDQPRFVDSNRQMHISLIKHDAESLYTEYHAGGHDCWSQAYRNKALYEWMLMQSRHKDASDSTTFHEIHPLGHKVGVGPNGEEALRLVLHTTEPISCGELSPYFDLHFEVRFTASQMVTINLLNQMSSEQFALELCQSGSGSGSLFWNAGDEFKVISPRAQNQLNLNGWNSIRLRIQEDHLRLAINGFDALDAKIKISNKGTWNTSILPSGDINDEMLFRFIKWRPLGQFISSTQ
jgi:poly(3-hydroxybutyrate) depolymerase